MLLPQQQHESRDDQLRVAVLHAVFSGGQVQLVSIEGQPGAPAIMARARTDDSVAVLKPDGTFMAEFKVVSRQQFDQKHPQTNKPMKGTALVLLLNPECMPKLAEPKDFVELLGGTYPVVEEPGKEIQLGPGPRGLVE